MTTVVLTVCLVDRERRRVFLDHYPLPAPGQWSPDLAVVPFRPKHERLDGVPCNCTADSGYWLGSTVEVITP